jgi:hypothetical protein
VADNQSSSCRERYTTSRLHRELLIKAGVKIEIPAEQGLANMAMTWKGMREIPEMVDEYRKVYETHKISLTLFGRCHDIYDRNIIPSEKLGKYNAT